jgi:hypothetical protein
VSSVLVDWRREPAEHVPGERPNYVAIASMAVPLHSYSELYGWLHDVLCTCRLKSVCVR